MLNVNSAQWPHDLRGVLQLPNQEMATKDKKTFSGGFLKANLIKRSSSSKSTLNTKSSQPKTPWFCCVSSAEEEYSFGSDTNNQDNNASSNQNNNQNKPSVGLAIELTKDQYGFTLLSVFGVAHNGPAYKAGIREGDILEGLNGIQLTSKRALNTALSKVSIGDKVRFHVLRGTEQFISTVIIESSSDAPAWVPKKFTEIPRAAHPNEQYQYYQQPQQPQQQQQYLHFQPQLQQYQNSNPIPTYEDPITMEYPQVVFDTNIVPKEVPRVVSVVRMDDNKSTTSSYGPSDSPTSISSTPERVLEDMGPPLQTVQFQLSESNTKTRKESTLTNKDIIPIIPPPIEAHSPRRTLLALAEQLTNKKEDSDSDENRNRTRPDVPTLGVEVKYVEKRGVVIHSVAPGGSAELAGIEPEDELLTWDGATIMSIELFNIRLKSTPIGSEVVLNLKRHGETLVFPVTVTARPKKSKRTPLKKVVR